MITFSEFQNISANEKSLAIKICLSKNTDSEILYFPVHCLLLMDKNQFLKTIQMTEYIDTKLYTIYLLDEEEILSAKSCLEDIYNFYSNSITYKPKYIRFFIDYSRVLFISRFSDLKLSSIYTIIVPLNNIIKPSNKNHYIETDMSINSTCCSTNKLFLDYIPSNIIINDGVMEQMFNSFKSYFEADTTILANLHCNVLYRKNNNNLLKILNNVFGSIVVNYSYYKNASLTIDFLSHINYIIFDEFYVKVEKNDNNMTLRSSYDFGETWTTLDTVLCNQHQNLVYTNGVCLLV
ncbi:hypothetical protein Catovirus_1_1011 [Catovirus CTV1]|uniref:Uncharacterized protein n=1 Tax=Catovirus CTV1 TaxID=1977631 RepID=A0A1V0SBA6_9VIRU|nr:hypothetical protein Catovirus_1_1011 [Catovirus CTV1]